MDVIKTKQVNIFATKFSPDLEADTLKEKLDREVTCWTSDISAKCTDAAQMSDLVLWPAGTFVRRYFEPRPRDFPTSGTDVTDCNPSVSKLS